MRRELKIWLLLLLTQRCPGQSLEEDLHPDMKVCRSFELKYFHYANIDLNDLTYDLSPTSSSIRGIDIWMLLKKLESKDGSTIIHSFEGVLPLLKCWWPVEILWALEKHGGQYNFSYFLVGGVLLPFLSPRSNKIWCPHSLFFYNGLKPGITVQDENTGHPIDNCCSSNIFSLICHQITS